MNNLETLYRSACAIAGNEEMFGLKIDDNKELILNSPIVNKLLKINDELSKILKESDEMGVALIERNRKLAMNLQNKILIIIHQAQQNDEFIERFSNSFINNVWFKEVNLYFLTYYNRLVELREIN